MLAREIIIRMDGRVEGYGLEGKCIIIRGFLARMLHV